MIDNSHGPLMPDVGVIAVVPERWGGMWLSRQQILTRLSRYYNVVWVNPQLGWRQLWFGGRRKVVEQKGVAASLAKGFEVHEQSLLHPKLYKPGVAGRLTARQHLEGARKSLARKGCKKFIVYLWRPKFAEILNLVDHDLSCYHIVDEYTFSSTETPIPEAEAKLIGRVDQVIIHSPALMEKKGGINANTAYITNGVDYQAFATRHSEPDDLARVAHPRIAYIGRIKIQLDWDILDHLSGSHPEWNFVFVGPMGELGERAEQQRRVFARANVFYLGNKSVAEIPSYTQHVDVCLLCYAINNYTKYIFPLKLHECLAAGKPVVGADIRTLQEFSKWIQIATTPQEWSEKIAAALVTNADTTAQQNEGRAVARRYDWNVLVHRIADILCQRMGGEYPERFAQVGDLTSAGAAAPEV